MKEAAAKYIDELRAAGTLEVVRQRVLGERAGGEIVLRNALVNEVLDGPMVPQAMMREAMIDAFNVYPIEGFNGVGDRFGQELMENLLVKDDFTRLSLDAVAGAGRAYIRAPQTQYMVEQPDWVNPLRAGAGYAVELSPSEAAAIEAEMMALDPAAFM